MNRPSAIAIGVAIAATTVVISVAPSGAPVRVWTDGIASGAGSSGSKLNLAISASSSFTGTGSAGSPLSLSVSKGTEFTGTGSAGSPLSLATAIQGFSYGEFGDGSDGVCDFDGVSAVLGVSPSSGRYKLTRDIFCTDINVDVGVSINAAAQIYATGTLQLDGRIDRNGTDGITGVNAADDSGVTLATIRGPASSRVIVPRQFCGSLECLAGLGYSATAACAAGKTTTATQNGVNGDDALMPGCGGSGGTGCYQAQSTSSVNGPALNAAQTKGIGYLDPADGQVLWHTVSGYRATMQAGGGGSAGSYGSGLSSGQTTGGGWVVVHAAEILGSGTIEARGGDGVISQAPVSTNCPGGSAGGGGGVVTIVINRGNFPSYTVRGGVGANGTCCSSGSCTGLCGGNGGDGQAGLTYFFRVGPQ